MAHRTCDYDNSWKSALMCYFQDFMSLYFPSASNAIDWSREPSFLDQELAEACPASVVGNRRVDKLVQVTGICGRTHLIYVHIEVQRTRERDFCERIFTYHFRLYDRFRCPIASMAVLADRHFSWRPDCFRYESLGCCASLQFPIAKVIDFAPHIQTLLASDNPFALFTAANLLTMQTCKAPEQRLASKIKLVALMYERKWSEQRILEMLDVLNWLMRLPRELQARFIVQIEQLEGSNAMSMSFVESLKRNAQKQGYREGREEGFQAGRRQAMTQMLKARFGRIPNAVQQRLNEASIAELDQISAAVLKANSLAEIFGQ
ncbi:DUF4351 domain-containing protein [Pseudoduganella sp. UC29_106]|uniref:DUF4351 domain-containing protein n=1 Tax=Pseudoduganella sp. UC29_106 TaxID=3374553 RepID=UPI0037580C13